MRHLVELHHGAIDATSEGAGKGTEFVVHLPLPPGASLPDQEATPASDGATGRVVVVDDDVEGGESMAILLQLYGYDVRCATDLDSALQVGQAFRHQAVLMDISMPGADGYEVARPTGTRLARRLSAIPEVGRKAIYIAVTGFSQPNDLRRSQEAGFAYHLVKPVNPNELDQLLRQALRGSGLDHGRWAPAA